MWITSNALLVLSIGRIVTACHGSEQDSTNFCRGLGIGSLHNTPASIMHGGWGNVLEGILV